MSEVRLERGDGWQALSGDRLRVEFRWHRDRWRHILSVRTGAGWRTLLRSAEFTRSFTDPGNHKHGEPTQTPALQQLHVDTINGRICALGVGQAGAHHFATTFSLETGPATLWVDVADRCREPQSDDARVVSVYELADRAPAEQFEVESTSESEAVLVWNLHEVESVCLRVTASREPSLDATVRVARAEPGTPRLTIEPGVARPGPATRRWVYGMELTVG